MVVLFLLGLAFGSLVIPRTVTQTLTQTSAITAIGHPISESAVTATVVTLLVEHVVATCTTISGTRSIVYAYVTAGETTNVTTVYPPNLPHEYQVTLVTASTVSGTNQTIIMQPDTC